MDAYLDQAQAAGYLVLRDPAHPIDPIAGRMLATDPDAVGLAVAGDVIQVAVTQVPTPARIAALEEMTGLAVTVVLTSTEVLAELRARALATPPGHPGAVLGALLQEATAADASDVILTVGQRPAVRTGGVVSRPGTYPLISAELLGAARQWAAGGRARATVTIGQDRWRVTATERTVVLHRLPGSVPRLEDLRAPSALGQAAALPGGLVVIASGTGGGRTTTAAAVLDRVNTTRQALAMTIADPVEYRHRSRTSTILEPTPGLPASAAFAEAAALGVNVIAVEITDQATARGALTAALAGHLVIATVAAGRVADALAAIVTLVGDEGRTWALTTLAATIRVACAQVLIPAESGASAVFETLTATPALAAAVRAGAFTTIDQLLEADPGEHSSSLTRSLALSAGRIAPALARALAPDPELFDHYASRVGSMTQPLPAAESPKSLTTPAPAPVAAQAPRQVPDPGPGRDVLPDAPRTRAQLRRTS